MTQIIDGRKIRDKILENVKKEVSLLPFRPVFCDILVGENPVSRQYVEMKARYAKLCGMTFHEAIFPGNIKTEDLILEIENINKIKDMCGVIVQLPLPSSIDKKRVLDAVDSRLDVDCLSEKTSEKFYKGDFVLGFPAALACMNLLDSLSIDLKNKNVLVLGQGDLVGRPIVRLLELRGVMPLVATQKTEDKEILIKEADIIISGIGQGNYIKGDMIKSGVILIDAGTSESNSGIVGDVDFESVKDIASFVSPVPGGVGPATVAMLLNNVLEVAKRKAGEV